MLKRALAAGFAMLIAAATPQSVPARDILSALPAETLIAIHAPDAHQLAAAWTATPLGKFYRDPAARDFFAPARANLAGILNGLGAPGLTSEALLDGASGGVCLAALPVSADPKDGMSWVLIAETGADGSLAQQLGTPATHDPHATLSQQQAQSPGGLTFTRFLISREEISKSALPKKKKKNQSTLPMDITSIPGAKPATRLVTTEYDRYIGDGVLILAEGKGQPIGSVLDRLKAGAAGSGAGGVRNAANFAPLAKSADAAPALEAYFNLTAITPGWEHAMSKTWGKSLLGMDLSQVRLDEMQSALVTFNQQQGQAVVRAALLSSNPRQGILQIPYLHGPAPDAAQAISGTTQFFAAQRLPLDKMYDIIMGMLGRIMPLQLALVQTQLQAFEQRSGLSIRKELVGSLGDQIAVAAPRTVQNESPLANAAILVSVRDATRLAKVMENALQFYSQMYSLYSVQPVDYAHGAQGWAVREAAPGRATPDTPVLAWIELTSNWLVVGSTKENVEAALTASDPSIKSIKSMSSSTALASQPAYRHATARLSPQRTGEVFGTARSLLAMLADALPQGDKKSPGWLNADALPGEATFARYFGPTAGERLVDGDVLTLQLIFAPAQ